MIIGNFCIWILKNVCKYNVLLNYRLYVYKNIYVKFLCVRKEYVFFLGFKNFVVILRDSNLNVVFGLFF